MQNTTTWSKAKEIMNAMVVAESDDEFAILAERLEGLSPFVPDGFWKQDPADWVFSQCVKRLTFARALYRNYIDGTLSGHKLVYKSPPSNTYACKVDVTMPTGEVAAVSFILTHNHSTGKTVLYGAIAQFLNDKGDQEEIFLREVYEEYTGKIFSGLLDLLVRTHVS